MRLPAAGLPLLALAVAAGLLVFQVVLLGKLPDHFDYWQQEYVHLAFLHRWLRAGELPLWNAQLAGGTPHLADPQSAVLYPLTTLPLLVLPLEVVARLSIPLHFFLAGASTYGYARSICLTRPAATAAGLAYALAPHFAPLEVATYLQQSAAWTPAVLWALHAGFRSRRAAPFALAGSLWALQLSRGYAQTWYVTGLLAAAFAGFHALLLMTSRGTQIAKGVHGTSSFVGGAPPDDGNGCSDTSAGALPASFQRPRPARRWIAITGPFLFAAVGLGLGAAQLLPSLDLLSHSQRRGGFSLTEASGPGRITLLNLLGAAGPDSEVSGAFPGGVTLALALAAVLYARGAHVRFSLALAATALALCVGDRTPVWWVAYALVPGFATLHMPHRMLFLWSLAVATLAGCGVDALARRPSLRPLAVAAGAVGALAWLAVAAAADAPPGAAGGAWQLAAGLALTVVAAQSVRLQAPTRVLALLPPPAARVASLVCLPAALACLVAADLLIYNLPRLHGQFYPAAAVYVAPPAAVWLQERLGVHERRGEGPYRFASAHYRPADGEEGHPRVQDNRRLAYLPPNVPALYPGLEAAQGYLAIRLAQSGEFFNAINDLGRDARVLSIYDPRSRLLDLLNVRYFVADNEATFPSSAGVTGHSLVAEDPSGRVIVREPLPARELEVLSSLGDAVEVEDGEVVAEILLRTTDERELRFAVRAGEHTAEWLYDAPHVAGTVRHRKAPPAHSRPREGNYQSHVYRARFSLEVLGTSAVRELELRTIRPRVRWNVEKLILHTPFTARFQPAYAAGALRIWENPAAFPRAWWVGGYLVADERQTMGELLKDPAIDLSRLAVLDHALVDLPSGHPETPPVGPATIKLRASGASTRDVEVDAPAAGLLVLSETHAPGWRAWVDGRPVAVHRADSLLQAVRVPAGSHHVRLRYLPNSVVAGAAISLATAALLGAVFALSAGQGAWRRRHGRADHASRSPSTSSATPWRRP